MAFQECTRHYLSKLVNEAVQVAEKKLNSKKISTNGDEKYIRFT